MKLPNLIERVVRAATCCAVGFAMTAWAGEGTSVAPSPSASVAPLSSTKTDTGGAAVAESSASAQAEADSVAVRRITLADALHLVNTSHPSLAAHQSDLASTDAMGKVARARMLPAVAVGDMLTWSDASIHVVSATAAQAGGASPLAGLPAQVGVNVFYAGVKQPLVHLLPLAYDYRVAKARAAADADRLAHQRLTLTTEVRTRFASLFRALALADTARESELALAEQVARARAQLAAGSATQIDVLRLNAALAGAKQQRVLAESSEMVERAYLLELLGLADQEAPVVFVAPQHFVEPEAITPRALLRQTALSKRADLSAAVHVAESLRLEAKARAFDLLPRVDLQANYLHLHGQPAGHSASHVTGNVFAAGLSASWPIWTWGAQWQVHRAARARAQAARSRLDESRRAIGQEVASRHAAVLASDSGVSLAEAQVADAEEAFRVMAATLQADAATTTDLLDAEAGQTRARNALIDARFSAVIARLALAQALGSGQLPSHDRPVRPPVPPVSAAAD